MNPKCKIISLLYISVFIYLLPICTFAQGELPPEPLDTPIDGGLSLVLAAGAGYLVKRRHNAKKKKAAQDKEILP